MDLFVGNADLAEYMGENHASGKRKRFGRRLKKLWTWVRRQNDSVVESSAWEQPQKPRSGTPEDIKHLSAQLRLPDRSLSRQSREGRPRSLQPGQTASLENTVTPRPRPRSSTTPPPVNRISVASSNGTESDLEWPIKPPPRKRAATAERVVKPIRMRVHYSCHLCGSNLSGNTTCSNPACQHRRCNKCKRNPDRRVLRADEINAMVARELEHRDPYHVDAPVPVPKMFSTTLPLGGLPPGKRPPRPHRVRCICARICHHCSTPFVTAEHLCQKCDHILCLNCPKDPPRGGTRSPPPESWPEPPRSNSQYPSPRPSDSTSCLSERVRRRPRIRVKYQCEHCHQFFEENSKICVCGHVRCETCPRDPPRRTSNDSSTLRPSTSSATMTSGLSLPPSLRSAPSLPTIPNMRTHPAFSHRPRFPRSPPQNLQPFPSMPVDKDDQPPSLPRLTSQRSKQDNKTTGRMVPSREAFAEVDANGRPSQ